MKKFILGWNLKQLMFFGLSFLLFALTEVNAQESNFYHLSDTESESRALLSNDSKNDVDRIFDLMKNLHPMIYIENGEISMVTEEDPSVMVLLDSKSFEFLQSSNKHFKSVELLNIHINDPSDLNQELDFSKIEGFNELKYIYIQCNIECTESQIKSMILNSNPNNIILFKVLTSA